MQRRQQSRLRVQQQQQCASDSHQVSYSSWCPPQMDIYCRETKPGEVLESNTSMHTTAATMRHTYAHSLSVGVVRGKWVKTAV